MQNGDAMIDAPARYQIVNADDYTVHSQYPTLFSAEARCEQLNRFKAVPFPQWIVVEVDSDDQDDDHVVWGHA